MYESEYKNYVVLLNSKFFFFFTIQFLRIAKSITGSVDTVIIDF